MSATIASGGLTAAAFETFLAGRSEPDWMLEQRRAAWRVFESLPLPSARDEEWRRTDLRLLRLDRFAIPGEATGGAVAATPLLREGLDLGGETVSVDSHLANATLDARWQRQGVLFGGLSQLASAHSEQVRRHLFGPTYQVNYDKFAALHAAAWSGGTLLYVPRGVRIDQPLHQVSALAAGQVDFGHTLVVLEEGAEATLVAESAGGGELGLHCGGIELVLEPGAKLRYVNLQNWSPGVWHFAHQKARIDRGAALQWTIGALGARLAKVNQHVALVGRGAQCQVNGVMFTEARQHLAYHTLQHHEAEACHSDLLYKGALQDKSRLVWRGMIKVDPLAQKTDAYQRNDNLMLSEDARADSIPGLEIEADDVRCTHGSTCGRVDDEQVFYAQARGLTRNEAVRMIVAGFFQQVFDRITIESVREALALAIGRRIRNYD